MNEGVITKNDSFEITKNKGQNIINNHDFLMIYRINGRY